jgi:hypothetical protein
MASLVVSAALSIAVTASAAAQPSFTFLRGTIDSIDGNTMVMTTRGGETIAVELGLLLIVGYNVRLTLADLDAGVELGVTTVEGRAGVPVPIEVHVLDNAGNVHEPWQNELEPTAMMTNGVVTDAVNVGDGRQITVHYGPRGGGGDWTVVVPPDIPVLYTRNDGDRSLLLPGAYVFVAAMPTGPGTYRTNYVQAEKDGIRPAL